MVSQSHIDALEHESGLRPLGEYPDHCDRCFHVAACEHLGYVEVRTWAGGTATILCDSCGINLPRGETP